MTPDAVESIHTVGGRLHPLEDLDGLLAGGDYPFLLFEPSEDDLPPGIRERILGGRLRPDLRERPGRALRARSVIRRE